MKTLTTLILTLTTFNCYSQVELGYLTGVTKQGVNNPTHYQPVYGITLQRQFNKYINLESDVLYSQRMNYNRIQADYFQYMLQGKFGYFGNKLGIYVSFGGSLNPTLDHSNPENHTYVSIIPSVGGQLRILPKTILEAKVIYDKNVLNGGYCNNNHFTKYKGIMIITIIKFQLK